MRILERNWGGPANHWYYFIIAIESLRFWEYNGKRYCSWRWGMERFWHDGPHCQFKLLFLSICWSMEDTTPPFDFCTAHEQWKWMQKPKWIRWICDMEPYDEWKEDMYNRWDDV